MIATDADQGNQRLNNAEISLLTVLWRSFQFATQDEGGLTLRETQGDR